MSSIFGRAGSSATYYDMGTRDEDLVDAVVRVTRGYNLERVAALITGVSASDLSRWQRGEWKWLSRNKRAALDQFFEQHGGTSGAREYIEGELSVGALLQPVDPAEARQLRQLLDQALSIAARIEASTRPDRGAERMAPGEAEANLPRPGARAPSAGGTPETSG